MIDAPPPTQTRPDGIRLVGGPFNGKIQPYTGERHFVGPVAIFKQWNGGTWQSLPIGRYTVKQSANGEWIGVWV